MGLNLETSLLGSFVYLLMRTVQVTQSLIPWCIWWICVKPALLLLRNPSFNDLKADKLPPSSESSIFEYSADTEKFSCRVYLSIVRLGLHLSTRWSGMLAPDRIYSCLLSWNPKFPALGYLGGSVKATVEIRGKKFPDGSRGWDLIWISSPVPAGRFQILAKECDLQTNETVITCVWTSGRYTGKVFKVGPHFSRDILRAEIGNTDMCYPSHVFSPPKWLVLSFEILVSAGLILPFLGIGKDGWDLVIKFVENVVGPCVHFFRQLITNLFI